MNHDSSVSPVGWYVGTYIVRFCEKEKPNKPNQLAWENTVLVRAGGLAEAYDKIEQLAGNETKPYRGGPEGKLVQWKFEGVTELLPIYEEIEDGAEIMWREHKSLSRSEIKSLTKSKAQILQGRI